MNFINLNTGKIYNGDAPYVHYFDGVSCTGLIYNTKICFIHNKEVINVSINNNDVFSLIDHSKIFSLTEENINEFPYLDLAKLKTNQVNSRGVWCDEISSYIHIIYIIASSNVPAEYIDSIYIDNDEILIGIDIYDSNESLYINMSNMGINIPNAIQKAIYLNNVHEDKEDKSLLNRKWKELLNNYWDIVANRGSYKSLINSLKWFEWGDLLKLKELWKYDEINNKVRYKESDIINFIGNLYKTEMTRFSKTTYLSINMALYELNGVDENFNPIPIKKEINQWAINDIVLKLSMLGNFFETYFMPIHLDLYKCTIEDIVFTNNIILFSNSINHIEQIQQQNDIVKCNINNGDEFLLSDASAQVRYSTIFNSITLDDSHYELLNTTWISNSAYLKNSEYVYRDTYIIGVDEISKLSNGETMSDEELKLFMSRFYNGVGVLVKIEYSIPLNYDDFVQSEQLFLKTNKIPDWYQSDANKLLISDSSGYAKFQFNILCRDEAEYDIRMNFRTGNGTLLTHKLNFKVVDDMDVNIGIFKIKNIPSPSIEDWYKGASNDYYKSLLRLSDMNDTKILQYIPVDTINNIGVRLNSLLVLEMKDYDTPYYFDENFDYIKNNYFISHKEILNNNKYTTYTVCVSKKFYEKGNYFCDPTEWIETEVLGDKSIKEFVYKYTREFFPEFHYLEELGGNNFSDYTVHNNEAICAIPYLAGDRTRGLKYSKDKLSNIENIGWTFENITTGDVKTLNNDIREPFITNKHLETVLDEGFYNVYFKYRLGETIREVKLLSAFYKKNSNIYIEQDSAQISSI